MDILRVLGLFTVIPTVLLITVSFFVMFTLTKVEKSVLRIFGMVAVGLLWIAALVVFSAGLLIVAEGPDYFGDHGLAKSACRCQCSSMRGPGCGMMDYSYHKKMMNPHQGMIANPHEGMMMDPHQGIIDTQPSSSIKK
ncbi:MAG: hypothetical protein NTY14_04350 [Candidatus Omnitrophica bacterium]|nr:hypothetical protein [Candidatus Omnitrophota bacterium]